MSTLYHQSVFFIEEVNPCGIPLCMYSFSFSKYFCFFQECYTHRYRTESDSELLDLGCTLQQVYFYSQPHAWWYCERGNGLFVILPSYYKYFSHIRVMGRW